MHKQLTLSLCSVIAACTLLSTSSVQARTADRLGAGLPQLPNAPALQAVNDVEIPMAPAKTTHHNLTDEMVVVGTTEYDYQANGTLSKMIAISSDGMVHGVFMGGDTGNNRRVKAWCSDSELNLVDATNVLSTKTGYTTVAVTGAAPGNTLEANSTVVGLHTATPSASWFSTDFLGCTNAFNSLMSSCGTDRLWPHVGVDSQDRIHMVSYSSSDSPDPNHQWYQVSTDGASWDAACQNITTDSEALGGMVATSKTSDRVAVLTFGTTDLEDIPFDMGEGMIGIQIHHDIEMFLAEDGDIAAQIDAGNRIEVTDFGPDSDAPFGKMGSRAYCDVEAIFDHTEDANLHIAYSGGPQWTDSLHLIWDLAQEDSLREVYMHWSLGKGQLWHHNYDTGSWSLIAGTNCVLSEAEGDTLDIGRVNGWRMKQDRPSLAVDPETGYLYCVWSQYFDSDRGNCAGENDEHFCNGEVFAACSADNGETWGTPVNLTNTFTPDCVAGDCQAEDWPSVAEIADGYLHITYVLDLDAGGVPMSECSTTINDVIYHRVPVEAVQPYTGDPEAWNAQGRVGLAETTRWYKWYSIAWCGDAETESIMDSLTWYEPVVVMNETPNEVQIESIEFLHHADDEVGVPGQSGLVSLDAMVFAGGQYWPVQQWNGIIPPYTAMKFQSIVSYEGYPNYDQLLAFHFVGDHPSLYYRIDYKDAVEVEGDEPCMTVQSLDSTNPEQYEALQLADFLGIEEDPQPVNFVLEQNHPNPFNPTTQISYVLPRGAEVSLRVFNIAGQQVATLVDGYQPGGRHTLSFDGSSLSSGVYFYRVDALGSSQTRKMILAK